MSPWIPLFLALQITDLTPASSPTSGGGVLLIDTNATSCPSTCPATVTFGSQVVNTAIVHSRIVVEHVPPHERGVVDVRIEVKGETASAPLHYTTDDDFERVLVPLVVHSVLYGAYGAAWRVESSAANTGDVPGDLWLVQDPGVLLIPPRSSVHLGPHSAGYFNALLAPNAAGAIARIGKWVADDVAFSSRVHDISLNPNSHGTTVPVVREEAFRPKVAILDVPAGPQSRTNLRIYSMADHPVTVTLEGHSMFTPDEPFETTVTLPAAGREVAGMTTLELSANAESRWRYELTSDEPVWAMASVTNNATNEVTVVWPQ